MTEKEQPIAEFQKIRLAYDEGRNGEHLPATHGNFSEAFYRRTRAALRMAPGVVQHVMSMITVNGGTDDRVDGSRDSPIPMNLQAFNDVNEVYSQLVYFANLFARKLHRQAPGPAKRAWSNAGGKIVGLPSNVTPDNARYLVGIMAKWLEVSLDDILDTPVPDDVQFFHDEFGQGLFRINAAWPQRANPRYSDMPCPDCGGKIAIYPPERFEDDERIVCESCGLRIMPNRYDAHVRYYNMLQAEADPVKRHLMKKYLRTA